MIKQAVILAAGKGVRMLPLTKDVPKSLIKINDAPFIYYLLKTLESAGYEKVFLVVGYKAEKMQEFVDNSSFNFELKLIIQKEQLGTGHAVKIVGDFVKDNFVVINGDNLFSKEDLSSINFEDDYNYVFAIEHETPERFGVLRFDNEFLIGIDEKPEKPVSNIINAGMYKFTPEVFDVLETIKRSPRGEYELTCAIEALAKKKKFKVKKLKDFWVDLGVYEDVPKVEAFVKSMF